MPSSPNLLTIGARSYNYHSLPAHLGEQLVRLPYCLRIMVENCIHHGSDYAPIVARDGGSVSFFPSRLILQDMLALPLLLDVMTLREEVAKHGGRPGDVDLKLPVDLIIDHSMTVENWASPSALARNQDREFEVNLERFTFFKACEKQFENLRVIPPGGGIMHQINLEFLGKVANTNKASTGNHPNICADTVLGTDSHTPMINGLGILGWGIGGLDAESIMFGQKLIFNTPEIIGLKVHGSLSDHVTATDLALTLAERLRKKGVVGKFVELLGPGYESLSVPDRATLANMAPEYGATCVYCPIDNQTIAYLLQTGRKLHHVDKIEAWATVQKLWREPDCETDIIYDEIVELDLSTIGRSVSGPGRPEQRMDLADAPLEIAREAADQPGVSQERRVNIFDQGFSLADNDIIIAAITSCTNTANPRTMITAGLVARNAVKRGLDTKPWVKTSLAPGSRAVAKYLTDAGLQPALDALGFHVAGFACTTCNGMSGPLDPDIETAIKENDLHCAAVLSGNRNFAGRIHALARANVLASPPLVVAYAIAGTIEHDIAAQPLGLDHARNPVYLSDIWPEPHEIDELLKSFAGPAAHQDIYNNISNISAQWSELEVGDHSIAWDVNSTYVTRPKYFDDVSINGHPVHKFTGLRPLAILGDNITTDHISPSGYITPGSAAGQYLLTQGVAREDFNSFGTRRGSNDVVIRSTFSSLRLQNLMADGREGPYTRCHPEDEETTIFEAIERYADRDQKLIVIAGLNYGGGSSRDTAAKAPWLAGVRAVLAQSFERIHRSNLINIGIAPLEFKNGANAASLGLNGSELCDLTLSDDLSSATMEIYRSNGTAHSLALDLRLDNDAERATFRHGGLLPRMLRQALQGSHPASVTGC